MSGQLINTGAFEVALNLHPSPGPNPIPSPNPNPPSPSPSPSPAQVSLNGKPVWSKIESGRFPQMHELVHALKANGLQ